MSMPGHVRFELHPVNERLKLLVLALCGVTLVTVVGFSLLWAN